MNFESARSNADDTNSCSSIQTGLSIDEESESTIFLPVTNEVGSSSSTGLLFSDIEKMQDKTRVAGASPITKCGSAEDSSATSNSSDNDDKDAKKDPGRTLLKNFTLPTIKKPSKSQNRVLLRRIQRGAPYYYRASKASRASKLENQKQNLMVDTEQVQRLYEALRSIENAQSENPVTQPHSHTLAVSAPPPHVQLKPLGDPLSKSSSSLVDLDVKRDKTFEASSAAITDEPIPRPKSHQSHADQDEKRVSSAPSNLSETKLVTCKSGNNASTQSLTLWKYLLLELGSQNTHVSSEEKTEQLGNFIRLPFYLERVIIFGSLACFDSFLYIFTILPLRFCYAIIHLFLRMFRLKKQKIPLTRKIDIIKGIVFLAVLYLLMQLDTSKIYHGIRGQSAIKLYVMFNVLEIADKLCSALGIDILDCLFSANTLDIGYSKSYILFLVRLIFFTLVATFYVYIHSNIILYQIISLNVAVNSYSNALLTLLLSNQFSEIKSTVFKKFERENLFQLTCADVAERFQITIMMLVIGLRNIVEVSSTGLVPRSWSGWNRWLGAIMGPMIVVVGSEVCVDWLKHAYIAKFNNIRPRVYRKFLDVLVYDYSDDAFSDQIMTKRIGIPIIPLASVFLRMLLQSYSILVEYQQSTLVTSSSSSTGSTTASFLPTCSITSLANSIILNETRKVNGDVSTNLSFSPIATSLSSASSLMNFPHSSSSAYQQSNSTWIDTINAFFITMVPYYFEKFTQPSYYTCLYSSFRNTLSSCMPDSADSFYATATMVLIVAISFILLFTIKLLLGLFLLQYTSKRRAIVLAKSSKPTTLPPINTNPSISHHPSLVTSTPLHSAGVPSATNNINFQIPPAPLTVPTTPTATTRTRSSSQVIHGSRRHSISRSSVSAGVSATVSQVSNTVPKQYPIITLPVSNPPSTSGSSGGATLVSARSGSASSGVGIEGYESDESDHVPGPIKGQGLVEVNETVRERMYAPDEPVPPPKPRKTYIKDFKDLCKIQRFKMTAKQIW
ncbi:uncharacterized protein SAPINGB_P003542 [Magnusiomyces paraingens]|uniref:DUF747 family protein n=1 Tax=Magnusiomyces paraingens TaxID=2606893 RepID=A0A5E8BXB8_9ASCO|nr:uncharacterized protein SAPINGB_P003542 [Saprochaete ingens]VVT53375.1 unnamed protein product [Saprochaete ingens]